MSKPKAEVYKRYDQTPKGRYRRYRSNARQRGIEFDLSFEEFAAYWAKECHYCGYKMFGIGLDRIINSKGYTSGNVVPCCSRCNAGKSDLSQAAFFELCRNVAIRHNLI